MFCYFLYNMQNNQYTILLKELYEANLRSLHNLSHERTISRRILNTNDHIVNVLTTLMSPGNGMVLNSEVIVPSTLQPQANSTNPGTINDMFQNFANGNFHDPVLVFPSPLQIQEGILNVVFSSLENPLNDACPISLNAFQPYEVISQIRGCGHIFNRAQLGIWLRTNCRCPVCRFDVRTYIDNEDLSDNMEASGEHETAFNQNATAIFNLLSDPTVGGAVVRDLSGNSFNVRSFYAA